MKSTKTAIILSAIAIFCSLAVAAFYYFTAPSIVYIDSARLLNEYQGMIDARTEFQKKAAGWQANVDTLTVEVQRAIMDYEKSAAKMSTKEKELSRELIKTKQDQLRNYQQAIQQQSQQEDATMTQQVLSRVNSQIEAFGKAHNYTLILGATTGGNLVYAQDGLDITDEVVEMLNKEYLGN